MKHVHYRLELTKPTPVFLYSANFILQYVRLGSIGIVELCKCVCA